MDRVRNYSKELEKRIQDFRRRGVKPTLLLHACCAPCSSYCLEYLREDFHVTVFYYNPNITDQREYEHRKEEEKRLIAAYNEQVETQEFTGMHSTERAEKIGILDADYDPENWLAAVHGLETCREGGERCTVCFEQRLRKTARAAREGNFDFFSTTLTISPLKDAPRINRIGERVGEEEGVAFLNSDFKKKNGYQRSIELSREFGLYRQNYCGCAFSKAQSEKERALKKQEEQESNKKENNNQCTI